MSGREAVDAQRHVEAIRQLIYRYAELIDGGDVDGFARLFAHGTLGVEGTEATARGSDEVRALMSKSLRLYDGVPATRHVNTNCIVTLVPDAASAEARTCFTVFQALPDFPLQAIVVGRYLDRFRRGGDVWRFERRVIAMDLVGDVSRHLAAAP